MTVIHHRFNDHVLPKETEIVILGTFNPDTPSNRADIFYGRRQNSLWHLLPAALGASNLKFHNLREKLDFLKKHNVAFIDLIRSVDVEPGQEANYSDHYLDGRVLDWRDVLAELKQLPSVKKVCFTRRTFTGIPNMYKRVNEIAQWCSDRGVAFRALTTPSRGYTMEKQAEWTDFFGEKCR